jgi:hypothetical protein
VEEKMKNSLRRKKVVRAGRASHWGREILDFGFWILDFGFWILDFEWKGL